MKKYQLSGYVYGKLWGGNYGAYPATIIARNSRKEAIDDANKMLKDGSLDSGMGFEELKSANLTLKITDTIIVNNKLYQNESFEEVFIGDKKTKGELMKLSLKS